MSNNLYFHELNKQEIYIEIIKRFCNLAYNEFGDMLDLFGKEWKILNRPDRESAAEMFRDGICKKIIRGVIFEVQNTERGGKTTYLYKRIPNDRYQK